MTLYSELENMMRSYFLEAVLVRIVCCSVGCSPTPSNDPDSSMDEPSLQVIGGSQLPGFVRDSELPVLVEFGVDYNCPRCEQTKSDVAELGDRLDDRVKVVRVDFNSNVAMVSQLGGGVCPTYVLFDDGEPILTRSFPLSIDLLESEIEWHVADR